MKQTFSEEKDRKKEEKPAEAPRFCDGCKKQCKLTMPGCGHGLRMAKKYGIAVKIF